uniref:RNA-directed DNA polymerase n=1 Tax=Lygus hesperus TaxID=30085 RepID=A0A146KYH2_LYGHE
MNNHDWEYCRSNPNRKFPKSAGGATPKLEEKRVNTCALNPQGQLTHQGNIHPFIFDSGSECSLLSLKLVPLFSGQKYNNPVKLTGIGHGEIIVNTQISTIIQIDNIEIPVVFYVVPEDATSHDILLGRDILSAGISINILPDRYEVTKIDRHKEKNINQKSKYLKRKNKPVLNKNSTMKKVENSEENEHHSENEDEIPWPIPCGVPIIDKQVESITATEGPLVGPIIQGSTQGDLESETFCPETEVLNTDETQPMDLARLRNILQKFSNTFTRGLPRRPVNVLEFKIILIDPKKVVYRRPYRLHPRDREAVREYIKELLEAGIIEESTSPYSSPILLVPKKNGKMRMATDFRELNSNTVSERFPLPLIQDQLARLSNQNYFTSLDCASGFYGIPTSEDTRQMLAFSTPDSHYQYRRMPFGVKNAPACYQRAIITALGDLANTYCLAYLDDLLIVSSTKEEAFTRLEEVLGVLDKAGFSLNPDKCSFIKKSTIYLGYEVRNGEIRPHNDWIEALTHLPPPKDRTALRSFLGLCSYFRNFVPNFSQKCAPLYKLTSTKEKFEWTSIHEKIRQDIIHLLTNEPCLTIFRPECPIEVWCDASSIGYGSIIFNIINGERRVVGYLSRRTTPAEEKYHSYELETLAAVKSFKHWECFLLYHDFILVTDCKSFQASFVKQNLITRVHRWFAYLQSFVFYNSISAWIKNANGGFFK